MEFPGWDKENWKIYEEKNLIKKCSDSLDGCGCNELINVYKRKRFNEPLIWYLNILRERIYLEIIMHHNS
jgi:hypothetical protein